MNRSARLPPIVLATLMVTVGCGSRIPAPEYPEGDHRETAIPFATELPGKVWEVKLSSPPFAVLAYGVNKIMVLSHRGEYELYQLDNGERSGRIRRLQRSGISSVWLDEPRRQLFIASMRDNEIKGYDLQAGRQAWAVDVPHMAGNLVSAGEQLFVPLATGKLLALAGRTGATVWERRTPGEISHTVVSDGQQVFTISENGRVMAFSPSDPQPVWERRLDASPLPVISIAAEYLTIGDSKGRLEIMDRNTGNSVFSTKLVAPVFSSPSANANILAVGLANGNVIGFDMDGWEISWSFAHGGLLNQSILSVSEVLILPYARGELVALDAQSGEMLWHYSLETPLRTVQLLREGLIVTDRKNRMQFLAFKAVEE